MRTFVSKHQKETDKCTGNFKKYLTEPFLSFSEIVNSAALSGLKARLTVLLHAALFVLFVHIICLWM